MVIGDFITTHFATGDEYVASLWVREGREDVARERLTMSMRRLADRKGVPCPDIEFTVKPASEIHRWRREGDAPDGWVAVFAVIHLPQG